jgi:hypothetical protein
LDNIIAKWSPSTILSRQELNDIIHKRKAFEMKIGNVNKEKVDFIQYIQYEISLTRLVQLRAKQMSMLPF